MWTATLGSPGTAPVEYQFQVINTANNTTTVLRSYSSSNQAQWVPAAAGRFIVQGLERQVGSTAPYDLIVNTPPLDVLASPLTITSFSTPTAFPASTGTPIKWTARVQGGTSGPIQYSFWRYSAATAGWLNVQPYGASETYTWTPTWTDAGDYALQVWVRSNGSTASYETYAGTAMKNLRISGCVMVTGPPFLIWSKNLGTTLPLLPSTLPNLTIENDVLLLRAWCCTINSASRFDAPITLVGFTALSVEMRMKRSTPCLSAARASTRVPRTLFLIASHGFSSISGTCLCAAACRLPRCQHPCKTVDDGDRDAELEFSFDSTGRISASADEGVDARFGQRQTCHAADRSNDCAEGRLRKADCRPRTSDRIGNGTGERFDGAPVRHVVHTSVSCRGHPARHECVDDVRDVDVIRGRPG